MNWKIGCSGYYYPDWRGIFYPPDLHRNDWFQFYCRHFQTIELNTTFYRFPRVEFLNSWYTQSPDDFTFAVKAPRLITHYKRFRDARQYLGDFYRAVRNGLKHKLGPVLFQFPGSFAFDENRLEKLVRLTSPSFSNVFEFRHESWWNEKVLSRFAEANLILSGMDHPALPADVVHTSTVLYYRFHGTPHLYISKYANESLENIAREIQGKENLETVYVFFNNTAEGSAIANAQQFQQIAEPVH